MTLFPITLQGRRVRLEPLELSHIGPLCAAASESRENYRFTNVPADEAAMRAYVELALSDAKAIVPFATIDLERSKVVGTTRFANLERWSWPAPPTDPRPAGLDAAEIGWTWLAQSAQRTAINTEAKLLMLIHAFEVWRVRRMTWKTDARNARSRAAIERIGGKLDGIWRAQMPAFDGGVRDTAYFSMIESEWPAARARLEARLSERGSA